MTPVLAALIIALVFATVAVVRPVAFVGVSFLLLVMAKSLDLWSDGLLSYLDETLIVVAVVVLTARRLITQRSIAWFPGLGWFAAFAAFGIVSGVLTDVSVGTLLGAAFLAVKGIAFGFAVVQVNWDATAVSRLARGGAIVLGVLLVAVGVNAIIPDQWTTWFTRTGQIDYILGLPSMVGLFVHPGDLGLVLAVAASATLAYRAVIGKGPISLILLVGAIVGALSSLRRKTVAGLVVAIAWVHTRSAGLSRMFVVGLVVVVTGLTVGALVTGFAQSTVTTYLVNWQTSPRALLYVGGVDVAATYFPWGAGFGRYGSFIASDEYSPEYVRLGFSSIGVVAPGSPYLSDTQWPAIVGEAGWFGGLFFALGLARMWIALTRSWKVPNKELRWERFAALVGMGWMLQILLESIAAPVFVTSPSASLAFFVVAIVASMSRQRAEQSVADVGPVDRLVAYQWDPLRPSLGGVDTCLRGLARYSPPDDRVAFVGIAVPGKESAHELGVWHQVPVAGRMIWFMAVSRLDPDRRTRLVPHGLRLAYGLLRYRRMLPKTPLVQGHKLESAAVLHWLKPGAALTYFVHSQSGALAARGSDSRWKLLGSAQATLERAFVRTADSVVVFNPEYAGELSAVNPRVTSAATWFDPNVIVSEATRDAFRVIWVGRIEPPKDAPLALQTFVALCELAPEHPWSLRLVGSGSGAAAVAQQRDSLPAGIRERVELTGSLAPGAVAESFATSGVLLMTTVAGYEGFPRVLVEGLASGLPAVVTDGTDTGSLITEGVNGFVRGRAPEELAQAIVDAALLDRRVVTESVESLNGSVLVPTIFAASRPGVGAA